MNETEFRQKAMLEGYGEPELHNVKPAPVKEMHTHDHSVLSLVLEGQFRMIYEDGEMTYGPGDWCENTAGTLHTEVIGEKGVVALVAKK